MHFTNLCLRSLAVIGAGVAMVTTANAATNEQATANVTPSVIAMNQKLKDDAVSITYAYLPQDGRLTILAVSPDGKGQPTVVGSTDLSAGDHRDVKVSLKEKLQPGALLKARVETSADKPFPGSDERTKQMFKVM